MKKIVSLLAVIALLVGPAVAQNKIEETIAKAEEQYLKGKIEEALKNLQKLVSGNPTSVEALLALGRMQERNGALADATASLAKAVDIAGSATPAVKAEALARQAAITLRRGAGKDALDQAARAVEAQATPAALAALARAQARVERGKDAIATAARALQAAPSSALCHEAEGEALLAVDRKDEAVAAFRRALEADPKLVRARVGLATALIAAGRADEAVTEATKAKDADQKCAEAFAVLGEAIAAKNPADWNNAIAEVQQGAFLNDQSAVIQLSVGRLFDLNANIDQAANSYRKALQIDPGFGPARLGLIQVEVRKGEIEAAEKDLRQLTADQPQNGQAFGLLGRVLLRKGAFEQAVDALRKAAELQSGDAETQALLGTTLQYSRKTAEAAAAYRRAVELDPKNLDYRTTAALLIGMTGENDAAIDMLKKVIATPGYRGTAAWINLGWVYRNADKTQDSVAAYRKVLELEPKNSVAHLGIAWAYTKAKLWDDAIAAFAKSIEADSDVTAEAENTVAWCYFFKKDFKGAREHMEKAKAAGRDVQGLTAELARIEKAIAEGKRIEDEVIKAKGPTEKPPEVDLGPIVKRLESQKPDERLRAVRELSRVGCTAVPFLGYQLVTDPDVNVREAVIDGLARVGPCARQELTKIEQFARSRPPVDLDPDKKAMEREMKEHDLRRRARELADKLKK